MPTYTAINKKTKKTKTLFMNISEMEQWELDNPNWQVLCGTPLIHPGGDLGLKSMRGDDAFKDRLREIDKKSPRNTLNKQGVKF